MQLIDVIKSVDEIDDELTIYATEPFTCDSRAIVAPEPEEGGSPTEAKSSNAVYFLEVFEAQQFLEGWVASKGGVASAQERCERLIRYAIDDA